MIAPRKYVHLLLMISELILIGVAISMIIIYHKHYIESEHRVWIGSKILTVNKIMNISINVTYPLTSINDAGIITLYEQNYETLLKHSGTKCEENYKKCGILDTMGNIMCIPETDECPINEIIESEKTDGLYSSLGYNEGHFVGMDEAQALYYTNEKIDNAIIAKLNFTGNLTHKVPRIIDESNFVFDRHAYYDAFYSGSSKKTDKNSKNSKEGKNSKGGKNGKGGKGGRGGGGGGGGGSGSGGGGFRKRKLKEIVQYTLYGNSEVSCYISERFDDPINIDKSIRNISDNISVGNYLGFKDYASLEKYSSLDLYNLYFTSFPHLPVYVFCYFFILTYLSLMIISMVRFCHKDVPNEKYNRGATICVKVLIIIFYLVAYIGFFIYTVCEYDNIFNKLRHEELINIKADPFIEDLLKEIYDRNPKEYVFIIFICMYILSLVIFILAWILSHHFTKKYLSLLEKTQQTATEELLLN